jgi:DNA-binding LacI/PurR family transcriptional regulator
MSATTPITQRDVAHACGLHPSTVCLALKNSPAIPIATRQRVQTIANDLGYFPNVAARNLALLRTEKKAGGSLPIAWINQEPVRDHWRADPQARLYFAGARRRAEELGYHLEEIWTNEPGMSATRVIQIVRARGIEGVIFPAQRSFDFSLLNPAWSDFAMVGFNDHRLGEWIDVVCPDYYRNTDEAIRRLRGIGFDRIGLVMTPQSDAATNGLTHSCYLRHQGDVAQGERLPVCLAPEEPGQMRSAFAEWLREHRPEVVLCGHPGLATWARAADFAAVYVLLQGATESFEAGIDECAVEVAGAAVECVVEKMRRFEKGIRESTRSHLIKGVWQARGLARREIEPVVA